MSERSGTPEYLEFLGKLNSLYEREQAEIDARFPKLLRKVAGYNLDHLGPPHANAAHLLVGSEGTLAWFERLAAQALAAAVGEGARRGAFPEVLTPRWT